MTWKDAALDLVAWLDNSTMPGRDAVRERYRLSDGRWWNLIRPDCNAEAVCAFLRAWVATGDTAYLTKSRAIWEDFKGLQHEDGAWPYSDGTVESWDMARWANANSEVPIFLLRAAELDPVMAAEYRAAALRTTDWLVSVQDPTTKHWRACELVPYLAPWSTAHACTALARAYSLTDNQAGYLAAIESGLAAVANGVGFDGRITTGAEVHGEQEAWRPPSSDQAICVRAFAMCARLVPGSDEVPAWNAARSDLRSWLDPLIHESGAVRNGYGVGVTNADVAHVTDHVYTTSYAADAYRQCYLLDGNPADKVIADGILDFAVGNIWYDAEPDANGCLRGAYDLTAQDFNTSEVAQNGNEEGGGDMAYTGWSTAPVVVLLLSTVDSGRRGASAVAFL